VRIRIDLAALSYYKVAESSYFKIASYLPMQPSHTKLQRMRIAMAVFNGRSHQ
jgi:hypothetical protein